MADDSPSWYQLIVNQGTQQVLEVYHSVPYPTAAVDVYPQNKVATDNQFWLIGSDGSIRSKLTGQALNVFWGMAANGTAVVTWPWGGGAPNELWTFTSDGCLTSNLGVVLDINPNGVMTNQVVVNQKVEGSATQQWVAVPGYQLNTIVQQPATGFPDYTGTGGTPALASALSFIQAQLAALYNQNPATFDFRSLYSNLAVDLGQRRADLQALPQASGGDFTTTDFETVRTQLAAELRAAADVRRLFELFQSYYTELFLDDGYRLNQAIAAAEIQDPSTAVSGKVGAFLEGLAYAALNVMDPEGWVVFSVVANLLSCAYGTAVANGAVSPNPFQVPIVQLWGTLSGNFESILSSLVQQEATILGDWGMLQAVEQQILASGPQSLAWPVQHGPDLIPAATNAYMLSAFQILLPAAYEIYCWTGLDESTMNSVTGGITPTSAYWVQSFPNGLYTVYALAKSDGSGYAPDPMMQLIWNTGYIPEIFFTNATLWPFATYEENETQADCFILTVVNQTPNAVTVEAVSNFTHTTVLGTTGQQTAAPLGGSAQYVIQEGSWDSRGTSANQAVTFTLTASGLSGSCIFVAGLVTPETGTDQVVTVSSNTSTMPGYSVTAGTSTPYSTQYQNPVSLVVYLH
ncbi:RICIN domain-containing protein [Corallococcus llansteffanensis]|uniref:Ricin B lectin domain-containing protein n=1 Tax=Corallococcus llansteffanensis TaxID=2316731 RepID=A0A3A8PWZ5_9BACT|nr:RICIN domain-containing protein [Corallococcus llansteffanensis]RKH60849.1 hypothetical protein D7V93_12690 [Corallococcus llansteffanensis]